MAGYPPLSPAARAEKNDGRPRRGTCAADDLPVYWYRPFPAVSPGARPAGPAGARSPEVCMQEQLIQKDTTTIDDTYQVLNARMSKLYYFVMHYNLYIHSSHRYGDAAPLTMIEVHTLSYIEDNPGVTPSDLVRYWDKSKSAVSQILNLLAERGLIVKQRCRENAKVVHLYVTDEGARISQAHKIFDIRDIAKTLGQLQKTCSAEEIDTFYKVIDAYNAVIREDFELNSGHRSDPKG